MSSQTNKKLRDSGAVLATEMVLPGIGAPETLEVRRRELPAPGAGEVIVRVEATGISFAEQAMRLGRYPGQPRFPFVPGYDLVGTVITLGPTVTEVAVGQRVAALTKIGGWSDHIILSATDLVTVPAGVDAAEAETVVVNGVTAWQMLHSQARVRSGQTILVHGATSGVGVLLLQLARLAGVRVLGTASPAKHDVVRALGAEPLDYHSDDLVAQVRALVPDGLDAVFDHVGGESLHNSWQMLGHGGTLVSYSILYMRDKKGSMIAAFIPHLAQIYLWNALPNGRHAYFYDVWGGKTLRPRTFHRELHATMKEMFSLLAQGSIQAQIARRLPLKQAAEGLRLAESGTIAGKIVLIPLTE